MANYKLADPVLRERVLEYIRGGHGKHEALHMAGVSPGACRNYIKAHPEFAHEIVEALNASIEPVTKMLRKKALDDEDVSAAKEYRQFIEREAPSTTQKVEVNHTVSLAAISEGDTDAVLGLQAQLQARRQQAQLEQGEVIEVEETET